MGRTTSTKKKGTTTKRTAKLPINSNSEQARKLIRAEMRAYVDPHNYGVRSTIDAIEKDANAYNGGRVGKKVFNRRTIQKGQRLWTVGVLPVITTTKENYCARFMATGSTIGTAIKSTIHIST